MVLSGNFLTMRYTGQACIMEFIVLDYKFKVNYIVYHFNYFFCVAFAIIDQKVSGSIPG